MSRIRNVAVATGLLVFAGSGLAFPFFFVKSKNKPRIDHSKPLPPQATFRGPYVNTGSRDIGPDHTAYPKKSSSFEFPSCKNGSSDTTSTRLCEASHGSDSTDKGKMARCYMVQCSISQNKRLGVVLNPKEVQHDAVESVTKATQLDNCNDGNSVHNIDDHVHGHSSAEPLPSSPDMSTGNVATWLVPGCVVWMRNSYKEWWPAEVMDEKQALSCNGNLCNDGLVLVQLYGSYEFAWVDPVRDLSLFDNCYEERSKNPLKAFQDALNQALVRKECTSASEQSDKWNASNLRTDDDTNIAEGRGRRKRKPRIHFDELMVSEKSMRRVRRMRIMRYLGLTAPVGSRFAQSHVRSAF